MTREFEFTLKFAIPNTLEPELLEERLFTAGCDDALIGIGQKGRVALNFTREADSAEDAVLSALKNVKEALPQARLVEAGPDLVGISDIAHLLEFTRQNMRKLIHTHSVSFPLPLHEGTSAIWHLADVLEWFSDHQKRRVESELLEVAKVNMGVNLARESDRVDPALQEHLKQIA